ncbi:MAG: DNA (cytosine-5-)-methyltransferase [Acidobacteria bacterium]|nr:MAG: DNA (cytosine-5-)-methyltransferase [Acidobacteriota bacterium]
MNDERPTHIDLFSGIGGFALAARWAGFRTVAFCEIDGYCQKVLAKNFLADAEHAGQQGCGQHEIPNGRETDAVASRCKIWSNIFDFDGTAYRGCDLLTGGFPCQPFSVAGKRRGAADDRALWPQMFRVISEARPAWILGENVPGIIPMELDNVLSDLESIGYACRSLVIPACAVDARHRRDRLWIVAKSNAERCGRWQDNKGQASPERNGFEGASDAADAEPTGLERFGTDSRQPQIAESGNGSALADTGRHQAARHGRSEWATGECCEWQPEPDVGRVAHGIHSRVDKLK